MNLKDFFKWITGSQSLEPALPDKLPRHIAIIMDGNGRWAKQHMLPVFAGHAKGAFSAWDIVVEAARLKIEVITLYAFSLENWNRTKDETTSIIDVIFDAAEKRIGQINKLNMQTHVIGDLSKLNDRQQQRIKELVQLTSSNTGLKIILAFSYSGQWDIVQAVNKVLEKIRHDELPLQDITADLYQSFLSFAAFPPPDLLIRTGGDQRISNFLLWQIAYTELYFTGILWPNFNARELRKAICDYATRDRRFGTRKEST